MSSKQPVIMIACGSGIASSTTAAERLKGIVRKEKLGWKVLPVNWKELQSIIKEADVLATIAPGGKIDYGVPTVNGVPLLTGIGVEEVVDQIKKILNAPGGERD